VQNLSYHLRRGGYPGVNVIHVDLSPTDFSKKLVELKRALIKAKLIALYI
jgi:hypothetical protein